MQQDLATMPGMLSEPSTESVQSNAESLLRRAAGKIWRSAFGKGALAVFDQAILSITNFGTSVIIGRLCTKEDLGTYALALSLFYFIRGIQEQLVSAPYMIYSHRQTKETLPAYAGSTLVHLMVVLAATLLCLLGLDGVLSFGHGPTELVPVMWVLLGAVPFMLLRDYVRNLVFAQFRVVDAIVIDVAVAVLQLGGLLLLGYVNRLNVAGVYTVMGLACAAPCVAWFFAKREPLQFDSKRFLSDWRMNWSFARWALAGQLIGSSTPFILPWVVAIAQGAGETGMLAACSTLVGVANMFIIGLSKYTNPKAAHAYSKSGIAEFRSVLWKTVALFVATVGTFWLFVLLTDDWLVVLVYGHKFTGAGPIIAILAFSMIINSIRITVGNGLWSVDRPALNLGPDAAGLLVTIVASIVLLPSHGALGAALATVMGYVVDVTLRSLILLKVMRTLENEANSVADELVAT